MRGCKILVKIVVQFLVEFVELGIAITVLSATTNKRGFNVADRMRVFFYLSQVEIGYIKCESGLNKGWPVIYNKTLSVH